MRWYELLDKVANEPFFKASFLIAGENMIQFVEQTAEIQFLNQANLMKLLMDICPANNYRAKPSQFE